MESYSDFDNEFCVDTVDGTTLITVTINGEDGTQVWQKEFASYEEARPVWAGLWQAYSDQDLEDQDFVQVA